MESKGRQVSVLDVCSVETLKCSRVIDDTIASTDFRMRCFNRTTTGIWHKTRLGVNTYLPGQPVSHGSSERFDVELEWRVPIKDLRTITDEIRDNILSNSKVVREIMLAFDDQVKMFSNGSKLGHVTVTVLVSLKWGALEALGGIVYLEELDLQLVPDGNRDKRVEHPFGPTEAVKRSFRGAVPHISNKTLVFSLKAVDNSPVQHRSDRYLFLGGEVYPVPIERDPTMPSGVHLVCRNPVSAINARTDTKDMCHKHYDFETADTLFRLCKTAEDAVIEGDRETLLKRELAETVHRQKIDELQMRETVTREEHVREKEFREYKEEVTRRRFQEEQVKENTRNLADWIKLVGGMMAAVVGVIGFINKLKPT